jgi:hypothetical protein
LHETSEVQERSTKVNRQNSSPKPVHGKDSRAKPSLFQGVKRLWAFEWGSEQQEAFDALNEYIQKLLTLASPQADQSLNLYVFVTHTAVSGA